MKEWFASRGRKWHIGLCVCLAVLASTDLLAAEGDRGPDNQITSQADSLEEGANQLPDAIHRLDPAKLAQQVEELQKEKILLTPVERKIASQIRAILHPLSRRLSEAPAGVTPSFKDLSTDLVKINEQGEVQVYVILQDFTDGAVAQLERMGLRVELTLPEHRLIQGWLRPDAIEAVAALDVVERITPPDYLRHNSGAVNSQGDAVLRADGARSTFGVDGSGVKVCVVSDGVNHLASSVTSGDLPTSPPVQVLNNPGGDEGTAMLEIIHDLAPGAALAFYGALTGAEFLQGLDAVTAAGCQVVVDDQFAILAPKFEDGLLAQKVQQLVTNGVVYVTAAGNFAQDHYFANYRRLLSPTMPPPTAFHNFSPTAVDIGDRFQVPPNGKVTVVLQWSNKVGASGDDFDLFLLRDDGTILPCPTGPSGLCASINSQNGQGTSIEALVFTNTTGSAVFANVVIAELQLVSDPATIKLNYFVFPDNLPSLPREYVVPEDSVIGHAAVNGVLSVAAVDVANPTVIELFSSRGPATILFPTPETRSLPNITAVNRVQTRVGQLGFFANPFFGTSAAAPHVAAIAALLWQFNPTLTSSQVVQAITQNAVDLGAPGFDTTFGFGRIDAFMALASVAVPPARLVNISTRALVQTGANVMIGGFIIEGSSPKTVVVRAIGPSLAAFGVPGVLANPTVTLFSGTTPIARNDDWQNQTDPLCASTGHTCGSPADIAATGFAPSNLLESTLLITLPPGPYTAIVSGVGGDDGGGAGRCERGALRGPSRRPPLNPAAAALQGREALPEDSVHLCGSEELMRLLRSVSGGAVLLVLSAAALLEREEKRDYYLNAIAEARIRLLKLEGY